MAGRIWYCKIGEVASLPDGADLFMRDAVARAYKELTGEEPVFTFSGWGSELTEGERAVVEDREPRDPGDRLMDREMWNRVREDDGLDTSDEAYESYCHFVKSVMGLRKA